MTEFWSFFSSLAIGLLLGLERERSPGRHAGLRTFALTALLGTLSGMLAAQFDSGLIIAGGIVALAAVMIAAYRHQAAQDDPGTTTTVALLLCYTLGVALWFGRTLEVVVIALAAVSLLHFKDELHGWSKKLSERDIRAILQFVAISFVILPLVPDRDMGPYAALNPHRIWWLVVLVCGVSLAAYALLRMVRSAHALLLVTALGGAVSSTGTTLIAARRLRAGQATPAMMLLLVQGSTLVTLLRLLALIAVVSPAQSLALLPVFAAGVLAGIPFAFRHWRAIGRDSELQPLELQNPVELPLALASGLIFAVILVAIAWLQAEFGSAGLYLVSAISGLTDLDAVNLSIAALVEQDAVSASRAVTAALLAFVANLLFKLGIVAVVAGVGTALRDAALGYLTIVVGLVGAALLLA